jgi:tetratricopeptide (TPR) repeat protein
VRPRLFRIALFHKRGLPTRRAARSDLRTCRFLRTAGAACALLSTVLILAASDARVVADKTASLSSAKELYQQRNFRAAIDVLNAALRRNPGDPELEQVLALAYYSNGNPGDAIPMLERLHSIAGPVGFDTSYLLGMCYLKLDKPDRARAAFAQMYSVADGSAAAHLFFARILVREHHEEQAAVELSKAIEIDPRLAMAHFLLGEVYLSKGATQSAISEFQKELQISPALWLVYWRLADAYLRAESLADAERAAKQAIWLNESFSGSYVTLGEIAVKRGDLELAQGLLQRAVKMEPGNQSAHYSLARVYQRLGRNDDATREFDLSRSLLKDRNANASLAPMP